MGHPHNELPNNVFTDILDFGAATIGWNATYAVLFVTTVAVISGVGYGTDAAYKAWRRRPNSPAPQPARSRSHTGAVPTYPPRVDPRRRNRRRPVNNRNVRAL